MFTIKQITSTGELLWEGTDVIFENGLGLNKSTAGKAQVSFSTPDIPRCTIDAGDVYVMNSAGNTVSKYHLDVPT